jgi:hypothetical protein
LSSEALAKEEGAESRKKMFWIAPTYPEKSFLYLNDKERKMELKK